ncbi:uncharacterized protein YggE [Caldicoprobacter guelmensis]|uniref:SIMPL domain-containing protein n=1 Tax=Caldicoprobacter guelmensis TaxID=1170224 RepID=UPI001959EEF7|nr:SIMPL domain-containing protein [Caldicoprobacter guelmensis]MBM7581705.1 uncharacterized protein YggE [Caldicoprobacter guelmensis]
MTNKILMVAVIVLAVACIGLSVGSIFLKDTPVVNVTNPENVYVKENIITVSGTDKVSVKPDVAYINVGVETFMKDPKAAQQENAKIMEKIINKLKAMGVEEKDIQTSNYHVYPQYNYVGNKNVLEGYRVNNTVRVTVRDVQKVGDILSNVHEEGANYSYGVYFGILDQEAAYRDALKKAIDQAKARAELIAQQSGAKLKKLVAVYEGSASVQPYYRDYVRMEGIEKAGADWSVPISEGEIEVAATVTLVYTIE